MATVGKRPFSEEATSSLTNGEETANKIPKPSPPSISTEITTTPPTESTESTGSTAPTAQQLLPSTLKSPPQFPYPHLEKNDHGIYVPPKIPVEDILAVRNFIRDRSVSEFLNLYIPEQVTGNDLLYLIFLLGEHSLEIDYNITDEKNLDRLVKELRTVINEVLTTRPKLPYLNTPDQVPDLIRKAKKAIIISGAGISTSLGIPDFRSDRGLYAELKRLGRSNPTDVFTLDVFRNDPQLFYSTAEKVLPPENVFTPLHAFIKKLSDEGKLLRNYTQNIDGVEDNAQIPSEQIVRCHGSFNTAHCFTCSYSVQGHEIFDNIRRKELALCPNCAEDRAKLIAVGKNPGAFGVLKPDITFFQEALPESYWEHIDVDALECDLLIVSGTSLKVPPVSKIIDQIGKDVPRILINMDPITHSEFDINLLGYCDDVAIYLSKILGWELNHEDFKTRVNNQTVITEESKGRGLFRLKEEAVDGRASSQDIVGSEEPKEDDVAQVAQPQGNNSVTLLPSFSSPPTSSAS